MAVGTQGLLQIADRLVRRGERLLRQRPVLSQLADELVHWRRRKAPWRELVLPRDLADCGEAGDVIA